VTVTNAGPLPVNGARVTDTFPPELTSVTWTCAAVGGACGTAFGSGDIDVALTLSLGATVTFTVNAMVVAGSGAGRLINVASVAGRAGITDLDPRNNSDADIDTIGTVSNHRPIAVDDTIITAGPIDIPGETLTANDSPGGFGEESTQTLAVTSVSGVTAQGGSVAVSGGVVTYTPPPGFLGTDAFTYTVTDSGDPALSATATVTVTVTVGGFVDGVGASGGGCGCGAGAGLAALPWYGIPAFLALVRRRRRKDGARPPG